MCEAVVDLIAAEAKVTNVTTSAISFAVKQMCALIGGPIILNECKFIVDNIDKIVYWVVRGFTNNEICKKLDLCIT
tara:strand:+ start:717 stop:944 length:228 start_codon:yes stop_codon:yes gene_type:complete